MKIKINNPCPENWEHMLDSVGGKYCEKCSQCVIDLTDKKTEEIRDIIGNNNDICGKVSTRSIAGITAGIILITNLTFVQAQVHESDSSTEQTVKQATKLSGRLVFRETQTAIRDAEVIFIDKSKLIKTTTNENGYFSLNISDNLIKSENVLYFNFDKINQLRNQNNLRDSTNAYNYGNQSVIFSRNEKLENKKFQIDYQGYEIGAVVIVQNPPPDYYYFNGKNISRKKFKKIKRENPSYQYFSFYGKEAEIISEFSNIETLYLLYSN